jgi:hypothetical protein
VSLYYWFDRSMNASNMYCLLPSDSSFLKSVGHWTAVVEPDF